MVTLALPAPLELLVVILLKELKATVAILLKVELPDNPVAILLKAELLDNLVLLVAILLKVDPLDSPVATHHNLELLEATHHNKATVSKASTDSLALLVLPALLEAIHHNKVMANKATEVIHNKEVIPHLEELLELLEATLLKDHQVLLLNNTTLRFHQTKSPSSKSISKRSILTEAVPFPPRSFKN